MARVVVIGANRRRQGTGEFVARWFHSAGATVTGVVTTSDETAAEARRTLAEKYGIDARAYADVRAALSAERPDVVAICSPFELHYEHLLLAAEAGADCLCEKPLVGGSDAPAAETEAVLEAFAKSGRRLSVVDQWPLTLPAFYELWPEARREPVRLFEMRLCPMFPGARMVLDAVPHVLGMLHAIGGPGRADDPKAIFAGNDPRALALSFAWRTAAADVEVRCSLAVKAKPPRPASYSINGRRVDRTIELPEYRMFLGAGERRVEIPDPLKVFVENFLRDAGFPEPAGPRTLPPEPLDAEAIRGTANALELLTRAAAACEKT